MPTPFSLGGVQHTGVFFGLDAGSKVRLRDEQGRWMKFDAEASLNLQKELRRFAEVLAEAVKSEFIIGGHDRGPLVGDDMRTVRSIDTIRVESGVGWADVRMSGGAAFVETGVGGHGPTYVSTYRPGVTTDSMSPSGQQTSMFKGVHSMAMTTGPKALHWKGPGGEDFFAKSVAWNPGFQADPFVERAMAGSELEMGLGQLASMMFAQVTGRKAAFRSGGGAL